jgi:flavin reductase (DIM6/NTAB) family NADH-FMN oxidoreductase RutF
MLHETLAQYLAGVEQAILRYSNAYVERYAEEILTPQRANLRIRLRFEQGHLPELNEAVVVVEDSLLPLDCRYHRQDAHNHVIFATTVCRAFLAYQAFRITSICLTT